MRETICRRGCLLCPRSGKSGAHDAVSELAGRRFLVFAGLKRRDCRCFRAERDVPCAIGQVFHWCCDGSTGERGPVSDSGLSRIAACPGCCHCLSRHLGQVGANPQKWERLRFRVLVRQMPRTPADQELALSLYSGTQSSGIASAPNPGLKPTYASIAAGESRRSVARFDARECSPGGIRAGGPVTRQLGRQMELYKILFLEQWLTIVARSQLRVICATPAGKQAQTGLSERFLCCVCRVLR